MKYLKIRSILLIICPIVLLSLYSCETKNQSSAKNTDGANQDSKEVAEDRNDDKFDDKDSEKNAQFVVDAVSNNLAEIKLATQAEERATNKEVKELATMLKTQHTALLNQLQAYAKTKVISVPDNAPEGAEVNAETSSNDYKDNYDLKWCAEMKDMHEKSIKKFEDAANDLSDADLKNLATQALPTLRTHYDRIAACHDKLKK